MKRGDLITVSLPGDYGKPRPALIVQSEHFDEHPSVTVLPLTSGLRMAPLIRVLVEPTQGNGLQRPSQVMVDKVQSVPTSRIGSAIGRLDGHAMMSVNRALAMFLGIA
jgi:mRNA interferase MazF